MSGLYRTIRDEIKSVWDTTWAHPDVPVYWRSNDADVLTDPSDETHFVRIEFEPGRERVMAFGGGRFANERSQFGSIIISLWTARSVQNEDAALDLMADATSVFRSFSNGVLSFIGEGSGFIQGPSEDGNWFVRTTQVVFQYRFTG